MSELVLEKKLPQGWTKTNLENTVEILDGKRIPVNYEERQKRIGNIPYYGATGKVGQIDDYLFDEELILLGEDGAPFFDNFKNKAYLINGKSWVNNHAHVLKGMEELLINKFLCHYLNQLDYHDYVNGTTRLKLNQTSMRSIPIILPPLNEQKRIVEKIDELFLIVNLSKQILEKTKILLKQYRQSLLESFFGKIPTENEEIHSGGKFFELNYVADVIDPHPSHRAPPKTDGGFPFAGIGDIEEDGTIDVKHTRKIAENFLLKQEKSYEINAKSIGYGRVGTVGKVVKLRKQEFRYALSPTMAVINPKNMIISQFLFHQLKSNFFFKQVSKNITGTTRSAIGILKLRKILVNVPSLDEQKRIVEKIETSFSHIEKNEKHVDLLLMKYNLLQNSILKQAFEGKLVPQDPNDESAEILFQKIKQEKEQLTQIQKTKKGKKNGR